MHWMTGDFTKPDLFAKLKDKLKALDEKDKLGGNVLFYMAVPDRFFGPIVDRLGEAGLVDEGRQGLAAGRGRKAVRPRSGLARRR